MINSEQDPSPRDSVEVAATAFRNARERASVAIHFEVHALHVAVYDAREAGLTVRETAELLGVDRRSVRAHWSSWHACAAGRPPRYGSRGAYLAAEQDIWSHAPGEASGTEPFAWDRDGVRMIPLGKVIEIKAEG